MTVTWRGAFWYAVVVVGVSWLVGVCVEAGLSLAFDGGAGSEGGEGGELVAFGGWPWLFPCVAVAALTVARRVLQPLPRWRVMVVDGVLYTVALIVCAGVAAGLEGDELPVDSAFVVATFALFTLQLPSAWLLSVWRSGSLEVVVSQSRVGAASVD